MSVSKTTIAALAALLIGSSAISTASAGIGNGNGVDKGNKNGWTTNPNGGYADPVPPGLINSGDNGRVDNGGGNGGENLQGETPNSGGEDAAGDDDPN